MKARMFLATVVAAGVAGAAWAQPAEGEAAQPGHSKEQLISLLSEAGKPEAAHQVLEHLAGDFEVKGKLTLLPGVDAEWLSLSKGRMILGGRFLELEVNSKEGEKPQLSSKTVFGFDSRRGVYTLWGVDTLGTQSVNGTGNYDAEARKLVLLSRDTEGGRTLSLRFTYQFTDTGYTTTIEMEMAAGQWQTMGRWEAKRLDGAAEKK